MCDDTKQDVSPQRLQRALERLQDIEARPAGERAHQITKVLEREAIPITQELALFTEGVRRLEGQLAALLESVATISES